MGNAQRHFIPKDQQIEPTTTVNKDGYPAYQRTTEEQYLQTLLTNTLGSVFYADSKGLLKDSEALHMYMAKNNPEFMAKALVYARNHGYMRMQPIMGLAILSEFDTALFDRAFDRVILIPSDLSDFMTVMNSRGHGEGGRAVKRAAARFLNKVSPYWALKYNGRGRGYNLGDLVRTIHPKPVNDRQGQIFSYLRGKEFDKELLPQLAGYQSFLSATTKEDRIKWINEASLPQDVVTAQVKPDKDIWNAILHQMPTFALLRHLSALESAGVFADKANVQYVNSRFSDKEALQKTKILPFRFIDAFDHVNNSQIRDILRKAVELTFVNIPDLQGETAIFLDVSGSMNGTYLRIGSIFGISLYKKTDGNGLFWTFDTAVYDPKVSLHDSVLTQAEKIRSKGGTDTGCCLRALTKQNRKVDNIIIITDEQQNTGSSFYRELKNYRNHVNKEAKAFVVDIAPYRNSMVPPSDTKTWYIFGWSEQVLQMIAFATAGFGTMVTKVNELSL